MIVVDKPAGLVVHPGAGNPDGTLVNGLLARFPDIAGVGEPHRPGIVHRLDAGSSGLLVVARTQDAADALIEQFASHRGDRASTWRSCGVTRRRRTASSTRRSGAIAQRPAADGGRRRRPAVAHRVPGARNASTGRPSWRCSSAGSRPGAPTRSASTSARSAIPLVGDPSTASAARVCSSSGRSCTPPSWPSTTRRPGERRRVPQRARPPTSQHARRRCAERLTPSVRQPRHRCQPTRRLERCRPRALAAGDRRRSTASV